MLDAMNTPLLTGFALLAAGCLAASAQEARTWTDVKGRKMEGSFLKQDDATVWVKRADGREVAIPKNTLSEDDLKHLESATPAPQSSGAPAADSGSAGRFNDAKIDPAAFKPREGGFGLGGLVFPSSIETDHYIVAGSAEIRPAMLKIYAEVGERLWHDMVADFPEMAEAFSDGTRMSLLIFDDEKEHKVFAGWHDKHAEESSTVSPAYNMERMTISGFRFDKKFAAEEKISTRGRAFRMDGKGYQHNRKTWPQRIHFLSGDLIGHWIGNPSDNGDFSLSMVGFCLSYHREQLICGRIESEVSFGGSGEVEGFKNGRNWAGATKKLLKAGTRPDIKSFLEGVASKANPRDLGFGLGLMQFIHKDPARRQGLSKLIHNASKDKKCPDDAGFAKGLGFDSPEALNAAWLEYMNSDAFQ
jgi:hypothetical protein